MRVMACGCGQSFTLAAMPQRPFVSCPRCGRRLPVHCEPNEFMDKCARCGHFIDRSVVAIHSACCMGEPQTTHETSHSQHV